MDNSHPLTGSQPTHFGEHTCEAFDDLGLAQATRAEALGLARATLANPDLPVSFVAESLMSLTEPRGDSLPFVPRGLQVDG